MCKVSNFASGINHNIEILFSYFCDDAVIFDCTFVSHNQTQTGLTVLKSFSIHDCNSFE